MDSDAAHAAPLQLPTITSPLPSPVCNPPIASNPPVPGDFLAATSYAKLVYDHRDHFGNLDPAVVVDAYRYREEVLARLTGTDVAPLWFQAFLQHFHNFEHRVNTFMVEQDIKTTVLQNWARDDGAHQPFSEVRFANGSYPTQAPHNYPPLNSAAAVNNLSEAVTNNYFDGYFPGRQRPQLEKERKIEIKKAIGCRLGLMPL